MSNIVERLIKLRDAQPCQDDHELVDEALREILGLRHQIVGLKERAEADEKIRQLAIRVAEKHAAEIDRLRAAKDNFADLAEKQLETMEKLVADNTSLRTELDLWRPLTPAEAVKAMDEAEAAPMSEEEIQRIVAKATDPAQRLTNSEQAQLVAENRRLQAENKMLRDGLENLLPPDLREAFRRFDADPQAALDRLVAEVKRLGGE